MDNIQPKSRIGLVGAWFSASFTCLIFAIIFSFYISNPKLVQQKSQSFNLFSALPNESSHVSEGITSEDGRAKLIENFFNKFKSPLADYSKLFVSVADKNGLDYKLLPSIAMQESNGGVRVIKNSYNPFGYGIYGNLVIRFQNWEEAIEKVSQALKEDYINNGLKTPHQIMVKYTPPSAKSDGKWAKGVSHFMDQLR